MYSDYGLMYIRIVYFLPSNFLYIIWLQNFVLLLLDCCRLNEILSSVTILFVYNHSSSILSFWYVIAASLFCEDAVITLFVGEPNLVHKIWVQVILT